MRQKVVDELAKLHRGNFVEIKFIDACRFNNVSRRRIQENKVFATYKRIVGEYYGTLMDMTYGEPFVVLIVEETNGNVDIVSVPERNIQKVEQLRRKRPTIKDVSDAGTPMLTGSKTARFRQTKKGVGENAERIEEEEGW